MHREKIFRKDNLSTALMHMLVGLLGSEGCEKLRERTQNSRENETQMSQNVINHTYI